VVEFCNDLRLAIAVERVGVPNVLVQHNKPDLQRTSVGLSGENVAARVTALRAALQTEVGGAAQGRRGGKA